MLPAVNQGGLLPPAGKLLGAFGAGWQVVLDQVPPTADMAGATLQPILATVARLGPNYGAPPVQVGFQPEAGMPNAEQLADICQVLSHSLAACGCNIRWYLPMCAAQRHAPTE